jgi:GntR family transcriptional regulator, carbon starvation induced regulator
VDTGAKGQTIARHLESTIRTDIISGALRPDDRLTVKGLALRYRVSATPVREALQHLAEQAFVQIDPQVGARVAPLRADEVADVYEVRALIESEATRRALLRGDMQWLSRVMREWNALRALETLQGDSPTRDAGDAEAWVTAHRAFHATILSACGSPLLLRFLDTLYDHSARYQSLLRRDAMFVRGSPTEHADLVDALLARDADEAALIVRTQLSLAAVRLLGDLTSALDSEDIMLPRVAGKI